MTEPVAFYHLWTTGAWEQPAAEHLEALRASEFPAPLLVGLVGRPESRQRALDVLGDVQVVAEADEGFEQVTLAALREYAQEHDQPIMYGHSKGASDPSPWKVEWRQSMTRHLIGEWREALAAIEEGADLAGPHWINDLGMPRHFSGNFWMGSAAYLRTLPPCSTGDRMDAEFWVGQNDPAVWCTYAGNPMGMFLERSLRPMRVCHVYHAWLRGDAWPAIVTEHLEALRGFDGPVIVGMVGEPDAQAQLRALFKDARRAARFVAVPGEWEQGTMELVRAWALEHPEDAVAYAHTKGASQPTEFNARWRQSMARHVIEGWRHCRELLLDGHDAVGPHWLHPNEFGESVMGKVPFFGGNYWMARCDYLQRLPPVSDEDRWGSERWIGTGNPTVVDLAPGWPGDVSFALEPAT